LPNRADNGSQSAPSNLLPEARRLLQAGRFREAEGIARQILDADSRNAEALYLCAVCLRYQSKPARALKRLEILADVDPDYGRLYQEQGHNRLALGQRNEALAAFTEAVRLNPALLASWTAIRSLAPPGQDLCQIARTQVERLSDLPKELVSVESMIHEGRLHAAEKVCRLYLKQNPKDVEAMRLLSAIGMRLNILDDAEFLLESAAEFEPDHIPTRLDYVNVLLKRQKHDRAFQKAQELYAQDPDNPSIASVYANAAMAIGRFDDAIGVYSQLGHKFPEFAENHLVRGHALKTLGRQSEAVDAYRSAYAAKSDFGDAYWSLANLKTYRFTEQELQAMKRAVDDPATGTDDRYHLCFALGKAFEDRCDYEQSFAFYQRGNALKKGIVRYSAERMDNEMRAQRRYFTKARLEGFGACGEKSNAPIFIVGLPRAGSTLLEQILASHSQVDGTLELPHILALVHRLNGRRMLGDDPRYPDVLSSLTESQFAEFGRKYLEDTRIYRKGAPRFTDKMPNNFRHIGLIHLILPEAKIIDARRDPMDCCFSCFKQLFAEGQEFTYGLDEIGRYYRGYVELMAHWDAVLPGKILKVQYEEVVADLEHQVRRILAFCDLPFEETCLAFHETERSVRTASSEQVRQPIYQSGVAHWRNFDAYLEPLRQALGPHGGIGWTCSTSMESL